MSQTGREKGSSSSALWRHWLMANEQEKYEEVKKKQRERERLPREKQREHWSSGTRAALEDKEAYLNRKREIARSYRERKKQEGSRQTRTIACVTMSTPRVVRQSMTPEERRAHDNRKRREAYHARSKQIFTTSTPLPGPCANFDAPQELRLEPRVQTPPKRGRMRQHCYNIASKVKRSLKNAFSDDEVAKITCNLVLRKTPEKRKKNVEHLLEHPVVRRELALSAVTRRTRESTLLHMQKRSSLRKNRYALLTREIKKFYTKPEISRVVPHKRYATKHGPGYVMLVTVDFAHKAFCQETGKTVSFSFFASLRPRNVRKVGTVATETCLCICCTNVKLPSTEN